MARTRKMGNSTKFIAQSNYVTPEMQVAHSEYLEGPFLFDQSTATKTILLEYPLMMK